MCVLMVNSVCWTDNEYLKVYNDYYDLQLACLDIRYPPPPPPPTPTEEGKGERTEKRRKE